MHYYETLHVNDFTHRIVKRGLKHSSHPYNTIKEVEFRALGRKFKLILNPHREVLHKNFRAYSRDAEGNDRVIHLNKESFFKGRVFGETNSHVHAHIDEGVITASIILPDDTYHIEVCIYQIQIFKENIQNVSNKFQPSWRHLPGTSNKHMVAYRASDIKLSWDSKEHTHDENMGVPLKCGYVKEGLGKDI